MKLFLSLAFLFLMQSSYAQIKHLFGPENVPVKDLRLNEVLGGDFNCFYTHKISTANGNVCHFIEKIDRKTLQSVWLKELNLNESNYSISLHRLLFNEDELIAFISKKNKKTKNVDFSVISYAANTLAKLKETLLTSVEMKIDIGAKVSVKTNPDNTMALMKISLPPVHAGESITELATYDIFESSKLWNKRITDNLKDNGNNDFIVDEEGSVHYVYFTSSTGIPFKETICNLHYTLITRHLNTKKITLPFDVKGNAQDIKIALLQNKTLSITGTFNEINSFKNSWENKSGIFNYVLDYLKSQVIGKKFMTPQEFDPLGIQKDRSEGIIKNYNIDDVLAFGNSCILIGHKSKSELQAAEISAEMPSSEGAPELVYYDIFLLKVNLFGDVEYCRNLPFCSKLAPNCYMDMCDIKQVIKQYINTTSLESIYVFHNDETMNEANFKPITNTRALSVNLKKSRYFVCNKISLKDGSNSRFTIEIPEGNAFVPVLEDNFYLAHPFESKIFDKHKNTLYVPIKFEKTKERFLALTLD